MKHFGLIAGVGLAACLGLASAPADAQDKITIGLPLTTSTFLPVYIAAEDGYFEEEGLDVEVVAFHGGTDLVRGMVAGAVDVGVTSLAGVNVGIAAGRPLKAFYGGFNMAVFDWYAVPEIEKMEDATGKRFGVSRIGSSTDFLTRYALQQSGLDPESDVQIVQGGGSPSRLSAMEAGQLDVNIFATPEKFMAADKGYNLLLKQSDLAPDYPFHVFFSTEDYIAENPDTIRSILRAFVKGVRTAKAEKEHAVEVLVDRVGMTQEYSERGYDDFIDSIREDGRLPSDEGMQSFWEIGIMSGTYEEPWPRERFWDSTFVDSYDEWKPE